MNEGIVSNIRVAKAILSTSLSFGFGKIAEMSGNASRPAMGIAERIFAVHVSLALILSMR
jgi:hypothetical protein